MLQLFKVMRSFLVTLYRVQGVPEDLYTWFRVSHRKPLYRVQPVQGVLEKTFIHGTGCPRDNLYTWYGVS